jgi:hypothetical protein
MLPMLAGDDAFLASITRVHAEMAEDSALLERFFTQVRCLLWLVSFLLESMGEC